MATTREQVTTAANGISSAPGANDQPLPRRVRRQGHGYLVYWNDYAGEQLYVFDRPVFEPADVGQALLNLELDLGADIDTLFDSDETLQEGVNQAAVQATDPTKWTLATRNAIRGLMGVGPGALAVPGGGTDLPNCRPPIAAGGVQQNGTDTLPADQPTATVSIPDAPPAGTLPDDMIGTISIVVDCGGSGGGGPPPDPCAGNPDPCCGDACCGDPCCGDPCCGDPCCLGKPCCDGPDPNDIDCDGTPNGEDPDVDGDGLLNGDDPDVDGDGLLNGNDPDVDGDGLLNGDDSDVDGDGLLNGDDPDVDGDGLLNGDDPDVDGDGMPNGSDPDIDGDGVLNGNDPDVDGDGLLNGDDPDVDGDGFPNGSDPDIDGDGLLNGDDGDMDGDGIGNGGDADCRGECVGGATGGGCDDCDPCTINDACLAGACVGPPKPCDDGNPCTQDRCIPSTGECFNPGACDDFKLCTTDCCDPVIGCRHFPSAQPCSVRIFDDAFACPGSTATLNPLLCNDGSCDKMFNWSFAQVAGSMQVTFTSPMSGSIQLPGNTCTCTGSNCTGQPVVSATVNILGTVNSGDFASVEFTAVSTPDEQAPPGCTPFGALLAAPVPCSATARVNVIQGTKNDPFPLNNATIAQESPSTSLEQCEWGSTATESLDAAISAECNGGQWCAVLTELFGGYSEQVRLLPCEQQVTGPIGNTTEQNYCDQVRELDALGFCCPSGKWYMIEAVQAHEDVHVAHLLPALQTAAPTIESLIEQICIPHEPGMTETDAVNIILSLPAYVDILTISGFTKWSTDFTDLSANDHNGATQGAEHAVVDPMISTICSHSDSQCWTPCPTCHRATGACCDPATNACAVITRCDCLSSNGTYMGDGINCGPPNPCGPP